MPVENENYDDVGELAASLVDVLESHLEVDSVVEDVGVNYVQEAEKVCTVDEPQQPFSC